MYDSGDSAVFWLNMTNIVLGLAVTGLLGLVLFSALRDIRSEMRSRVGAADRSISSAAIHTEELTGTSGY